MYFVYILSILLQCQTKRKTIIMETSKMTQLQDVYLSKETFEKDLEECLTIINYPTSKKPYYVCEHISAALLKRQVNVYVKK